MKYDLDKLELVPDLKVIFHFFQAFRRLKEKVECMRLQNDIFFLVIYDKDFKAS